jgi:hypothetical protein
MPRLRTALAATLVALSAAAPLAAQDYGAATHRGASPSRNAQRIDDALREFGWRPSRLTSHQVRAINDAWRELLGPAPRGLVLTRRQAVAIVYVALEHDADRHDDPYRPDRREDRRDDRRDDRRPVWGAECDGMQGDAYRLGLLVSAPERGSGLFVQEPELTRARSLARQIQEQAIRCRALGVADRAGEILTALSATLPGRSDVERRVNALKREIEDTSPVRSRSR